MLKLWKNKPAPSHEELFLTYYTRLLAWAMQLTGQDRGKAEDLVHDVFIQFTVVEPELSEVENLEGYLFATMRNLLRSQMRRQAVALNSQLSLLDYDSAELGLRARDLGRDVRVRDELGLICHYACVRKETSRAGSALILRFYLGYYPSEISRILQNSRQAVADLLGAARSEAKLYLSHPNRLGFMRQSPSSTALQGVDGSSEADFLGELRRAIFRSCQGVCSPRRKLKEMYGKATEGTVVAETSQLGHIVSCPRCLDVVNLELGLPPLAERYPTDTIGPDQGGRGGGTGPDDGENRGGKMSADPARDAVKRFRRRLKDVFEHEPKELHIAINGRVLGSQSVNAEVNRQSLRLDTNEAVEFIEVFSEQGVRLFSLGIEQPPGGPFEREAQVTLSGERSLHVAINFNGPSPSLEIVYCDPHLRSQSDVKSPHAALVLRASEHAALGADDEAPDKGDIFATLKDGIRNWPSRFGSWTALLSRRGLIGGLIATALIAAFLLFRSQPTPVSAAELLQRSIAVDAVTTKDPSVVVHRKLDLSVRNASQGKAQSRQRIEIWQSPAMGIKVRRLYDEQNLLVAGEWKKADGSSAIYRSGGSEDGTQPGRPPRSDAALTIDNAWLREPSAEDFSRLASGAVELKVQEKPNAYLLSFVSPKSHGINELDSGTLVLSRPEMRPIEQTLVVETAQGQLEFHFSETQFEKRPMNEVAAVVFEPDAAFLPARPVELVINSSPAATPSPAMPDPAPAPVTATAELEIEVLSRLDQVGAMLGEEVSVSRTLDGSLQIAGVVEGAERKATILSALAPLAKHTAARILIETTDEAQLRIERTRVASEPATIQIEETTPPAGTIGVDTELRRRLLANGTAPEKLDEEVNQYANRALGHSRQAMLYAWSLRRLIQRFSANDLQSLDRSARAKWLTLIIEHTQGFEREVAGLRAHLSPAFTARAAVDETAGDATDEAGLARLILRTVELSTITDEAIRSAFTLSGGDGLAISSAQFWRTISNAEFLAQKVEQGAQQQRAATNRTPR